MWLKGAKRGEEKEYQKSKHILNVPIFHLIWKALSLLRRKDMKRYLILFLISGHLFGSTTLYFVRHGQTDWNVQGKLQGHADFPLNQAGRQEAEDLSERIREMDFDVCFSSDLQRAMETARILSATRPLIIQPVPTLRGRDFGLMEGRQFSELLEYEKEGQSFPNIESYEEVQKRIFPLFHDIVSHYPGATVLIVTHGSVIRSFLARLLHIDSPSIQLKNLATLQVVASNGQYEIQESADIHILPIAVPANHPVVQAF
jgi:broad specificity phosphatase PhoE